VWGEAVSPGRVFIFAERNNNRHHVLRIVAERHIVQAHESPDRRAGRCHKQKGQRSLTRNQGRMRQPAFHAPGQSPCARLNDLTDNGSRRLHRGDEAE
jgi:hypothetical protein